VFTYFLLHSINLTIIITSYTSDPMVQHIPDINDTWSRLNTWLIQYIYLKNMKIICRWLLHEKCSCKFIFFALINYLYFLCKFIFFKDFNHVNPSVSIFDMCGVNVLRYWPSDHSCIWSDCDHQINNVQKHIKNTL